MANVYYAEEISAVPFKVLARAMSNAVPAVIAYPLAAVFRFRGIINWPLRPMYAVGELGSERTVNREQMPPRALSRWAPILEQFMDLGFRPLKYSIADMIGQKEHAAALFLDSTGSTLATLEWLRMHGAEGIEEKTPFEFNSYADTDPEIMTGAVTEEDMALADLLTLDFVDTSIRPNTMSVAQVYAEHNARIRNRPFFQMTEEAALLEHQKRTKRRFDWALEQGLMRPLTAKETASVRQLKLEG